ncbi:MAG: hypothetical protein NVS9B3_11790 [Gemmatimonadaceae bacterium]
MRQSSAGTIDVGNGRSARGRATAEPREVDAPVAPRTGARRTVLHYIRRLPDYVRLLWGLLTDPRVSRLDKLLVGGAIAYIVMPFDLIPDFIPFFGEVDDVYFLLLALQRLIANAGRPVVLAHWRGDVAELDDLSLRRALSAAAVFLPRAIRRRLLRMAGARVRG